MSADNVVAVRNKSTNQIESAESIANMPHENNSLHEEFVLGVARDKFRQATEEYFNNVLLQDMKESRDLRLKSADQGQLFLRHSENLLENLSKQRKKFDEQSCIFLAKSRHEIEKLRKDCRSINEEVTQGREMVRALFYPFNK